MVTAVTEVYDALREAGASEEKSRAAASAVASYDTRLSKVEPDLMLLKWMVGSNIALSVAMIGLLLKLLGH